jgi:hypothetical protein
VNDETRRIRELEDGFRHDGLPNLIVDLTATDDIFTRAIPFLSVVFLLEILNALDVDAGWGNLLLAPVGAALLIGAFGLVNVARGRRFFSVPDRVGIPELVAFVVLPALLPIVTNQQLRSGLTTLIANTVILGLVYLVVGFGLFSILRWTAARLFAQMAASMNLLVRAVPLLLFFSLVMFFTMEMWQAFTSSGWVSYWTAIGMFIVLAMAFFLVRLPSLVREVQEESQLGDEPLRRRERLNLAAVALISEGLQVLFVSAAVWLFYVVLGALTIPAVVRAEWLLQTSTVIWDIPWFGEHLQVTSQLLRVATGVAAFAALYYAVAILLDPAHRDQFVDALTEELRETFARRAEYLELLRRQGTNASA